MASTSTTSGKPVGKRIMLRTPVAVTTNGNISLFYKGQNSTSDPPSDGIYQSMYVDGAWKGGLDAPPICTIPLDNPSAVAVVGWSKTELRMFLIDGDYNLQEYCCGSGGQWTVGGLQQTLKIRVLPGSSLAAVHWYDGERGSCIRVFYQDGDGPSMQAPIKEVRWTNSKKWHMGPTLVYALPCCGIAAVTYPVHQQEQIHLFYQSLELTLSELYYHAEHDQWLAGERNLGIAGDSTPITAFGWCDGKNEELQVYWRNKLEDAELVGAIKSSKQSDIPKWKPIDPVIGGLAFDDKFAIAQWAYSKRIRLYHTRNNSLLELCNDDGAGWVPGAEFGGN